MRRTKPPVGWEHVKNCFPVPNELLDFDLPGGSIAVYIFLLRHADRRTGQCHPSTATMAKNLHYCRNTVASYVRLLEERGLIITEHTKIITKNGIKKNGNLLYNFGVILNYLFRVDKLMAIAEKSLPLHVVEKKVPYIDENGTEHKPETPNAYKFETLILDMVYMMDNSLPFEVDREKEFAPVKNATGTDSVETARALLEKNGIEI